jgi:hypothetical protein
MARKTPEKSTKSAAQQKKADIKKIVDTVRMLSLEFSAVESGVVEAYIEAFFPLIGRKVFGDKYFLAMAFLVMHKMKIAGLGDSEKGTVDDSLRFSSISVGNESVSFNNGASASTAVDTEYTLTSYGRQFLDIKQRVIISVHVGGMRL